MPTKLLLSALLVVTHFLHSQTNPAGLIICKQTEIRTEPFSKGSVTCKVKGIKQVEVIEVTKEVDGKGKKSRCKTFPWVKVKWAGDSTGWVSGKYLYDSQTDEDFITPASTFTFRNKNYQLLVFLNYGYPPWDAEGETGCSFFLYTFIYDLETQKYYPVIDPLSQKKEIYMDIRYEYTWMEKIEAIRSDSTSIYIDIAIRYRGDYKGGRSHVSYTLQWTGNAFQVASYIKGEDQWD
jgi:hypothetical protein